jgi:hypothetical protein
LLVFVIESLSSIFLSTIRKSAERDKFDREAFAHSWWSSIVSRSSMKGLMQFHSCMFRCATVVRDVTTWVMKPGEEISRRYSPGCKCGLGSIARVPFSTAGRRGDERFRNSGASVNFVWGVVAPIDDDLEMATAVCLRGSR